jgi:hypothetical protein
MGRMPTVIGVSSSPPPSALSSLPALSLPASPIVERAVEFRP